MTICLISSINFLVFTFWRLMFAYAHIRFFLAINMTNQTVKIKQLKYNYAGQALLDSFLFEFLVLMSFLVWFLCQ